MPKTRKQKEENVEGLSAILKSANVTFVTFGKLKVADERDLRKKLCESGSSYIVAKKTLWKRALAALGLEAPTVEGQLALAYGADTIAPAKGVAEFGKKHEGVVSIVGGIFEGKLVDAGRMQVIASVPGREVLLGMLANVLSAPMRKLAVALTEVSKQKS